MPRHTTASRPHGGLPDWACVASGGALGALARGGLDAAAQCLPWSGPFATALLVPWSTLLVNIVGAFLLGALAAEFARTPVPSAALVRLRLFAATGFAGAFTTYGTLQEATARRMLDSPSTAGILGAALASLGILIVGAAAAGLGWTLVRKIFTRGES